MHPYFCPASNMDSIWEITVADIGYVLLLSNTQALHASLLKNGIAATGIMNGNGAKTKEYLFQGKP